MTQSKLMNERFLSVTLPGFVLFFIGCFYFISYQNGYWTDTLFNGATPNAPPFRQTFQKQGKVRHSAVTVGLQVAQKQGKSANIPFLIHQREIQESRRAHLKKACLKYYNHPRHDVITNPPWNIFLDTTHKILYCNVPKVACTSWKRVLLVLTGIMKHTYDMEQQVVNNYGKAHLKTLRMIPVKDRKNVLETYTKFMFVRHPFSRVLSAYKNKVNLSTAVHKASWAGRRRTIASIEGKRKGATFTKFLKYIIPMSPAKDDRHWSTVTNMCLPCDIDYDVIGKFETLADDANYILKLADVDDLVEFPSNKNSSPTNSSKQDTLQMHYDEVPLDIIQNIYEKYILDFQLFNYTIPKLTFFK